MYIYEGNVTQQPNGKYLAVILKIEHDEPNYDTVSEYETADATEATIWVDDELSRLITGKGLWEK